MMRILLALLLLAASTLSSADVFRPAYLEITERPDRHYDIFWKVPSLGGGTRLSAYVRLPDSAQVTREPRIIEIDGAWNERWQVHVPNGLVGQEIEIEGNAVGVTDVIVRVVRLDGSSQVERLPIDRPRFEVKPPTGHGEVAWSYLVLGVEHILGGIDHLLGVVSVRVEAPVDGIGLGCGTDGPHVGHGPLLLAAVNRVEQVRNRDGRDNADDRNHDQQLDQRESLRVSAHLWGLLSGPPG